MMSNVFYNHAYFDLAKEKEVIHIVPNVVSLNFKKGGLIKHLSNNKNKNTSYSCYSNHLYL